MKTIVNALQYKQNSSGIGILIRELFGRFTSGMEDSCQVILPQDSPSFPRGQKTSTVKAPCRYGQGMKRMLFQSFVLGPKYCKNATLVTTDSKIPFFLPKTCRLISVITDLAVFRMCEVYQSSRSFLWKAQYRYLCRRGDLFVAISEFTKRELIEILHIPEEKIRVVPCAAPEHIRRVSDPVKLHELREKYHLPERYVLFVGNFNPRKNLERLIRAFDQMKKETNLPHELVVAGGQGWMFDKTVALRDIDAKESIRFLDYIEDADMSALYSAAEAFAFVSLYEGFGIPVIEAQRCGIPVLAANTSSLPEVGGDGAYYVTPYSEKEITDGLIRLLQDDELRNTLIQRGFENERRYSWDNSAELLCQVIEESRK